MEYSRFGTSEVEISRIGLGSHMFPLGAAHWDGYHGKGIREDVGYGEKRAVFERALELGVTLFDCDFDFEKELVGRIVADLGARDQVVLASWVDYRPERPEDVDWQHFQRAFDKLLTALQVERLDILNWRFGIGFDVPAFTDAFRRQTDEIKAAGKLRATAFYTGDGSDELICAAAESGACDALFRGFGFLNPQVGERVLPLAVERGLGFLGFIPFQKGWFFECAREAGLMEDGGADIARIGLKWVLKHAGISSTLVGVSTIGELEANCAAADGRVLQLEERECLMRLVQTECYGRFIELFSEQNPHVLRDWRAENFGEGKL
jgi:aryl-alcohol dehydrogenase-like predicted oxidoreductase